MQKQKIVVDTEIIKVFLTEEGYIAHIRAQDGSVLEHQPFPGNVQGLVNALDLATQVCAGKFFLRGLAGTQAPRLAAKIDRKV